MEYEVRPLTRYHLPEVAAIEALSFALPHPEDDLRAIYERRNVVGYRALYADHLLGFALCAFERKHIEVLDLAVRPNWRRQGVGCRLVRTLAEKLDVGKREALLATVRETALDAQLFLRAAGFRATHIHREHYSDTGESGYVMRLGVGAGKPVIPAWATPSHGTHDC